MAASGYAVWSVSAGEQPTTAKWNILGSNDASFNTGAGFNDSILLYRHMATNTFSTGVSTYTPSTGALTTCTVSSVVGYYVNLGGIRLCWGTIQINISSTGAHVLGITTPPASFFTTIQSYTPAIQAVGNQPTQTVTGDGLVGVASFGFYIGQTANLASATVSWLIIGT